MVTSMLKYAAMPVQPLRRWSGGARSRLRLLTGGRAGGRAGGGGAICLHRPHFLQDIADFCRGQHVLVRPQKARALVRYRLLQVGHDLCLVRIVLELRLRLLQISPQALKTRLFEMEGISVEIDDDDRVHGLAT
jgi:hypothetical protein